MAYLATRTWEPGAANRQLPPRTPPASLAASPGPSRARAAPDGRPVALVIHGITSSSRTWWQVAPSLASRGFRVVGVDLRGHGGSPPIEHGLTLADLAADVAETVELTVGRPVDLLVAHSLGALVTLELLREGHRLAERLALEDPPGPSGIDWVGLADGIEQDSARARDDPDGLRRQLAAENPTWPPYEVERQIADLSEMDAAAIAAALRGGQGMTYDLIALARTATVPTLLLLGEEALGSNLIDGDRAAFLAALPDPTTRVLPAGHSVHREALGAFLASIDQWLAPDSRPGRRREGQGSR
jgi:pimeloyl-ACP methyl ester carboxylesterase